MAVRSESLSRHGEIMATQTTTAHPTLSSLQLRLASSRPDNPGSRQQTEPVQLFWGNNSNVHSSSGSFYDLPSPSHGNNHSILKVPVWPGSPTHVERMTRCIWAQSTQSSAAHRKAYVGHGFQFLAVQPQPRQLFDGRQYWLPYPHNGTMAFQLTSQGYHAT